MTTNPLLDTALKYHQTGLAVCPIRSGSKAPFNRRWQSDRLSQEDLNFWFGQGVNSGAVAALGVVSGAMSGNLVVLDFDGPFWQAGYEHFMHSWPEMDQAPIVRTGSDRRHVWIKCHDLPEYFTVKKYRRQKAMIELRGNRCQTLCPPSMHPNGEPYEWVTSEANLPRIEFDLIRKWVADWGHYEQVDQPFQADFNDIEPVVMEKHLPQRTLNFLGQAGALPPGNRNSELYHASQQICASGYSLNEAIDLLRLPASRVGLDESEITPTIQSGFKAAVSFKPIRPAYETLLQTFLF